MAARKAREAGADRFRDLAQLMWLLAALRVVTALTTPVTESSTPADQMLASTILLIAHGFVYRFGAYMRDKKGVVPYLAIQATLAASIGLFSLSLWLALVVFGALGVQSFVLLRDRPAAVMIAMGSLLGLAVSASLGWDITRGVGLALVLATVGVALASVTGGRKRR